jgi:large subunit ribosomal protein L22
MGSRKRNTANRNKEEKANKYFAILRNCPISPRKMRLVADLVRDQEVNKALDILKYTPMNASKYLEKLLLSAISNWQTKNEGVRIEETNLLVSEIRVDQGRTLKRFRPAPQGRAHRIRKRSNHVTVILEGTSKESEGKEGARKKSRKKESVKTESENKETVNNNIEN